MAWGNGTRIATLVLGLVCLGIGCDFPPVELEGRRCPCAEGWVCDPVTDVCVQEASLPYDAGVEGSNGSTTSPPSSDGGEVLDADLPETEPERAPHVADAATEQAPPDPCPENSPDSDGDGVLDCREACPADPAKRAPGVCGCGQPDADSDGDGVADCVDECPLDSGRSEAGVCGCEAPAPCGCPGAEVDDDADGVENCLDACPQDPGKQHPGQCGCGHPETDSDEDGTPDCTDACPTDPNKTAAGTCGCGVADHDGDGDGVFDCQDACPEDALKSDPGSCGCGVTDADQDGDGLADCEDRCPQDPHKAEPGTCGCGAREAEEGARCSTSACPSFDPQQAPLPCACRTDEQACTLLPGLRRAHYTGSWASLPDFDTLTADAYAIVPSVDLGEYAGDNAFGLLFTGYLSIDVAGSYELLLTSDDGSRLYLDGALLIDMNGKQGAATRTATVELEPGLHPLRVEYFEAAGSETLQLRRRGVRGKPDELPQGTFVHDAWCAFATERESAELACPPGHVVRHVGFASFGSPSGACEQLATSDCHAEGSGEVVEQACLYRESCSVQASNAVFGDPCAGVWKDLSIEYVCAPGPAP